MQESPDAVWKQPNGTDSDIRVPNFSRQRANLKAASSSGLVTRVLKQWMIAPPVRDETFETDWVSGACMMIRRQVFQDVGFLDEGYYTYCDDCDFCFNARKKGWSTWYVPTGRVIHLKGQSTGVKRKNRAVFHLPISKRVDGIFSRIMVRLFAAMADAAQICGFSIVAHPCHAYLQRRIPLHRISCARFDSWHSVFATGFKVAGGPKPCAWLKKGQAIKH